MKLSHARTAELVKQGFLARAVELGAAHLKSTCVIVEPDILHVLRSSERRARNYGARMATDHVNRLRR